VLVAATVAALAPVSFTVAALPPGPLMALLRVLTATELKFDVPFAPLMLTAWLVGDIRYPV
jgi:hypothetical protein